VIVVVDPLGESEVPAIERCGELPVGDRQRDVVQRHPAMIAAGG